MYKMANNTKEIYEANGIEAIVDNLINNLWLNERHVETQLRLKNLLCTYKKIY